MRWGIGHAAGVLVVGAAALLLREAIDVQWLSGRGEQAVGAALVLTGLWGLWRASSRWVHSHAHAHEPGGPVHVHVHVHRGGAQHAAHHADTPSIATAPRAHAHTHAPFLIGAVHGLAGSAHVLGVVPALALPSRALAGLYLAGFAAGTVAAMAAFSLGVGLAAQRLASASRGGERAYRLLLGTASAAAVLLGAVWLARS